MGHPGVRLLVVTGGPGVVARPSRQARDLAGPGNPPVVVDETADIQRAGPTSSPRPFDNNIVCTDEKTVIAILVDRGPPRPLDGERHGAYILAEHELRRLERVIFTDDAFVPGKPGHVDTGLGGPGRDADPRGDRRPALGGAAGPGRRGAESSTRWSGPSR